MSRPLIGLTIGPERTDSDALQLRSTYPRAIEAAGGAPVLIPPLGPDALSAVLARLDGFVFPGGLDVDPAEYGEARHPETVVNPALDALEFSVARWAVASDAPILGICRGQQLLNVALGGSLVQHMAGHRQPLPRSALTHPVNVLPDSRLAHALGTTSLAVNSFHHQAINRLAAGLRPVAWAPDGTLEGIESDSHPWLVAVQFHPEDLIGSHLPSQQLFAAFIGACEARFRQLAGVLS